jgi:AcrR family transcriptional regulator
VSATAVPYAVAARELLRETLLDAAARELGDRDWPEITMGEIAGAAGVSRQTLYNEFGTRAEFAQALAMREAGLLLDEVEGTVSAHRDDPTTALQATFELFLTATADNPLVRAIVSGQGAEELLALFTTQGETLVGQVSGRLAQVLRESWPSAPQADAATLAEMLVRLAISHAALPKGSPAQAAGAIGALLGPYVERLVATSSTASRLAAR